MKMMMMMSPDKRKSLAMRERETEKTLEEKGRWINAPWELREPKGYWDLNK